MDKVQEHTKAIGKGRRPKDKGRRSNGKPGIRYKKKGISGNRQKVTLITTRRIHTYIHIHKLAATNRTGTVLRII
jgi:hypothetical protein